MSLLKHLLIKEFKQFKVNPFFPKLIFAFPVMIMLIAPLIATMDVKNINLTIINHDNSTTAERLIKKIEASEYFKLQSIETSYQKGIEAIDYGSTDLLLQIPEGMERNLYAGNSVELYIAANSVNSTKGSMGNGYLSNILNDFTNDLNINSSAIALPIHISVQYLYNPHLNYRLFMVPAMMIIVLILLCGFLPALNIVTEKERGTIEQINVTPVSKLQFIASKLIFYCLLGIIVFTITFILGKSIYNIAPYGNIHIIYFAAILFMLFIAGFGLLISNFSSSLQQAIFTMFFFVMIFMLLSGLFTPVSSMVPWAQSLTYILPPRYFVNIMRCVCLKGSGLADLWFDFTMLTAIMLITNTIAISTYKKQN